VRSRVLGGQCLRCRCLWTGVALSYGSCMAPWGAVEYRACICTVGWSPHPIKITTLMIQFHLCWLCQVCMSPMGISCEPQYVPRVTTDTGPMFPQISDSQFNPTSSMHLPQLQAVACACKPGLSAFRMYLPPFILTS
jgi:hypothetical protein